MGNISSYPSGFRGGAAIKNVPLFDSIAGNVFWVDSGTGGAGNPGSFTRPVATIAQGLALCTDSNGDYVMVFPGHAETVTAAIAFNKIGVSVVGVGRGNLRPTITGNGAIDAVDVSAANMTLANVIFAAPLTDAQTADVNVNAAGFSLLSTKHLGSVATENKVSFVTITADGDDCLIDGMRGHNEVVDMVSGVEIAACDGLEMRNCIITSASTLGYSTGVIDDTGIATNLWIHDCLFKNIKAATAVMTFASNSVGIVSDCAVSGRHTTIASNILTGTGVDFFETYVTEQVTVSGLLIPTIDS